MGQSVTAAAGMQAVDLTSVCQVLSASDAPSEVRRLQLLEELLGTKQQGGGA